MQGSPDPIQARSGFYVRCYRQIPRVGEAAPLSRALAFVELTCSDLEQITAAREGPASRENPRHQRHSNPVRMFWHVCCVDNWVIRFAFFG